MEINFKTLCDKEERTDLRFNPRNIDIATLTIDDKKAVISLCYNKDITAFKIHFYINGNNAGFDFDDFVNEVDLVVKDDIFWFNELLDSLQYRFGI